MRRAVVVVVGVDPVPPGAAPAVSAKPLLEESGPIPSLIGVGIHRVPVNDDGQPRVVRKAAVVGEELGMDVGVHVAVLVGCEICRASCMERLFIVLDVGY